MKKIFISGSRASGKSSLLRILDGNKKIGVIHHHDKIFSILNIFLNNQDILKKYAKEVDLYNLNLSLKNKGVLVKFINKKNNFFLTPLLLRRLLNDTAYFEIEQNAWAKKNFLNYNSKKREIKKFYFDFYLYDKLIFKKIFNRRNIKIENFFNIILQTYFKVLKKNYKYVACMLPNNINIIENILSENFKCKIIYIKRSLKEIITAEAIRNLFDKKIVYNNKQDFLRKINFQVNKIIYSKKFKNIETEHYKIINLQKNNFLKIMVINFKDLFTNKLKLVFDIFKFLKIKPSKINFHSTFFGRQTNETFDKINDTAVFTKENEDLFNFLFKKNVKTVHLKYFLYIKMYFKGIMNYIYKLFI